MPSPSLPNDYPVELVAPDISAYAEGNAGLPYVWRFGSDVAGPTAMISAVVHGNELCGAIALDWLLRRGFRPAHGSLVLAFVNTEAYLAFDPDDPSATRWVDEDFNRVWDEATLNGERDSVELRRARALRPVLDDVDVLLDLHSMQRPSPPLMMAGPHEKGVALATALDVPERIVVDAGHAAGRRMRDYGGFGEPAAPQAALLYEAGQHWEAAAGPRSKEVVARFLRHLAMDDGSLLTDLDGSIEGPLRQSVYEVKEAVTIQSDQFVFAQSWTGGEIVPAKGTLIGHDGDRAVRTPHEDCMLVMPSKRLWKGQTAVRLAQRRSGAGSADA